MVSTNAVVTEIYERRLFNQGAKATPGISVVVQSPGEPSRESPPTTDRSEPSCKNTWDILKNQLLLIIMGYYYEKLILDKS